MMFKMHNISTRVILRFVPGLAAEVFTKVNVPKLRTGFSPLSEPSVSFVMR
jgi:hypothetical protein